jgi:DnaJ domain
MTSSNPFAVLGLPAQPGLSDEDIRAAWRRVASATHPDREDGGDPARYAEASNAYTILRTPWGRSEAYADLRVGITPSLAPPAALPARVRLSPWRAVVLVPARVRHGRPARLVLRIVAAVVAALLTWHSGAGTPAVAALLTGIATWLLLTARSDLAPPPGR